MFAHAHNLDTRPYTYNMYRFLIYKYIDKVRSMFALGQVAVMC